MITIAHRGANEHNLENTIASFKKAVEMKVDMIELDVRLSQDAIPVVIHDATVDRTTSTNGNVADFSAKELQQLGVPTLADVFTLVKNQCSINIEIKEYEATQPVLDMLQSAAFDVEKIIISSFDWYVLKDIRFQNGTIKLGVLTETYLDLAIDFATFIKAFAIHPYYHLLTIQNVEKIKEKGLKLYTWTVNEPEDITFVKQLGVDGIITDYPERV
ncbi:glycerophosphodiester phosphodiesterase [Flavobacterium dankookense]|uniref:Glycerophosphoryl diester phosphodiesterase n=1 Tax=Flavobacterium dankookense TaxID=706186 RepID=A0A4R6Q9E0_9FLAO|nr:glycerophosphodiester phosphodiesterase family protein [Flavobacterium dankookense]TDP58687.1 glycerophosphoryl diester phosphodiesterase [Flavobacterium dankookense]